MLPKNTRVYVSHVHRILPASGDTARFARSTTRRASHQPTPFALIANSKKHASAYTLALALWPERSKPLLRPLRWVYRRTVVAEVSAVTEAGATVVVVDDDLAIRESLGSLLRSVGLRVKAFASVPEFLMSGNAEGPTCLVVDVRLPGRSGLDLQRELAAADIHLPIIFITGHGDIPMSVQAMKGGAIEFLTKPFRDQDLLDAIHQGIARDRARRENETALRELRARFETLTPREREVMAQVVRGRLNKQIAGDMGLSEITVKVHRGQVMRKMNASSLPDLARMADKLMLGPNKA
jgi:FixJ family two-component response regulator